MPPVPSCDCFPGPTIVKNLQVAFDALQLPIIAVSRRQPDMEGVRNALLDHVLGGKARMAADVYVQRVGIS